MHAGFSVSFFFSTTRRCLILFFKSRSAACSDVELVLIVTSGEDGISETRIELMFTSYSSMTNTFLTISRSVTKPIGLLCLSTTTRELMSLSFIFFAACLTESAS